MKFTYPSGAKPLQGYTIKRGIGIGGFGEVYFALNDAGKEVALKKIQRNLDIELRGVRQCLNIRHVNLIALWDIRTSKSHESWVVMEYVPGPSLRDLLDDHPRGIPEDMLKLWFTSIASGVAYLHHRGIVHRDLKPGNVFRDDDAHVIKIGDYGLSKFISSNQTPGQTGTVGTVHYMAPEISKGIYGKEIDIYALGIILYELLTGDVPFDGETSQEIMYKHLLDKVDIQQAPSKYQKVLQGSLVKEPESRFSNVAEMMSAMPWPEFAGKDKKVLSLHSVGVFPRPEGMAASPAKNNSAEQDFKGARIAPILISNENADLHSPEIVIGPLSDYDPKPELQNDTQDRLRQLRKTTPPRDSAEIGAAEVIADTPAPSKKLAKRTTVVGMDPVVLMDPASVESALDEMPSGQHPIIPSKKQKGKLVRLSQRKRILAKKVARKCHIASTTFSNHALATPIRVAILLATSIAISAMPTLLPLFVAALGTVFVSWNLMRIWAGASEIEREQRTLKRTGIQPATIRQWIQKQPQIDRFTGSCESILIGSLALIGLCLFGLATSRFLVAMRIEDAAYLAWVSLIGITATCSVLCVGKKWEVQSSGHEFQRRMMLAGVGLLTGIVGIAAAIFFHLDLSFRHFDIAILDRIDLFKLPTGFSWIAFFIVLFMTIRWWNFCDPLRASRLSLWNVGICLVVAAAIGQLMGLPLMTTCIFSLAVSASIQLAAPWLHPKQREAICGLSRGAK